MTRQSRAQHGLVGVWHTSWDRCIADCAAAATTAAGATAAAVTAAGNAACALDAAVKQCTGHVCCGGPGCVRAGACVPPEPAADPIGGADGAAEAGGAAPGSCPQGAGMWLGLSVREQVSASACMEEHTWKSGCLHEEAHRSGHSGVCGIVLGNRLGLCIFLKERF